MSVGLPMEAENPQQRVSISSLSGMESVILFQSKVAQIGETQARSRKRVTISDRHDGYIGRTVSLLQLMDVAMGVMQGPIKVIT